VLTKTLTSAGFHFKIIIMTTLSRNHKNTLNISTNHFVLLSLKSINTPFYEILHPPTILQGTMSSYSSAYTSLQVNNLDLQ
jgi:hypothetical protein